jgi:hypothetical protein
VWKCHPTTGNGAAQRTLFPLVGAVFRGLGQAACLVSQKIEAFFGYYPVQEHAIKLDGEPTGIWDLMGKDTILFHQR